MIEVVEGRIGGGKSCMAIYRMCTYIADGGAVYTNMRLIGCVEVWDLATKKPRMILQPDAPIISFLLRRYDWEYQEGQWNYIWPESMEDGFQTAVPAGTPEKKVLVVLDEVNEWFDALDRNKLTTDKAYRATARFFRQSRKVYIDVMLILQDYSTLNHRLRGLNGVLWMCRDMQHFEIKGVKLGFLFKHFFVWQKFDGTGKVETDKPRWVAKDKAVFALYDTTELFGDGLGVIPAGTVRTNFTGAGKRKKGRKMEKWQSAALVLCVCMTGACLAFILRGGGGVSSGGVVYVTNTVSAASSKVAGSTVPAVEWSAISYGCAGRDEWAYASGRMYRLGQRTDRGLVVSVDRHAIRFLDETGERWILHSEAAGQVAAGGGGVK